jgi:hypothetical protein
MQRALLFLSLLFVAWCGSVGPVRGEEEKLLRAAIAVDGETKPATEFAPDTPQLVCFVICDHVGAGQEIRAVWIAEDVGEAAPKETKIQEKIITTTGPKDTPGFTLTRPTKGWPVGKYRVDLYVGGKLAEKAKFSVKAD